MKGDVYCKQDLARRCDDRPEEHQADFYSSPYYGQLQVGAQETYAYDAQSEADRGSFDTRVHEGR